ncbi:MAG: hypothetical protein H6607_11540 [Flavobacteriales bacterium]|nr:hypothetical protein [Flavobacteriales bacterium]
MSDKLMESFKDFELSNEMQNQNVTGGISHQGGVTFGDDSTGAVTDIGNWSISWHTDLDECQD